MPKPTSFKTTNKVFGSETEGADQIAAAVMVSEKGKPSIVTKWKLSDEDLENLIENPEIWLVVQGSKMPALSVFTNPPSDYGYRNIEL